MHALGRLRQLGVDRGGQRVDEVRPGRIPEPEMAAAALAEMAAAAAALALEPRAIDREVHAAPHLQRFRRTREVDRVAAGAGRLPADRAVAEVERIGRAAFKREAHGAAMTG